MIGGIIADVFVFIAGAIIGVKLWRRRRRHATRSGHVDPWMISEDNGDTETVLQDTGYPLAGHVNQTQGNPQMSSRRSVNALRNNHHALPSKRNSMIVFSPNSNATDNRAAPTILLTAEGSPPRLLGTSDVDLIATTLIQIMERTRSSNVQVRSLNPIHPTQTKGEAVHGSLSITTTVTAPPEYEE
ncbi:hypothetical protein M422DRAFT_257461 [Sphaerobolus stellatus SS14]|uniref:Uncharacterized protein n=1 Tax=Sphaerobolus stellatus (strain SS14) TaxID=990650 RepID=A0A0C9U983_SPHS4|nr:hypothetical protein M422DRAFT_257461 [Sphaerobolus stellatus SS14]